MFVGVGVAHRVLPAGAATLCGGSGGRGTVDAHHRAHARSTLTPLQSSAELAVARPAGAHQQQWTVLQGQLSDAGVEHGLCARGKLHRLKDKLAVGMSITRDNENYKIIVDTAEPLKSNLGIPD